MSTIISKPSKKHLAAGSLAIMLLIMTSGCYTELAYNESTLPRESTRDSASAAISQRDTIVIKDRETCFWDRDFWGRPFLRCEESAYPRAWYVNNYAPWWYRNDPYYYDYRRCPRFYYYDPTCGCCQYDFNRSIPRYAPTPSVPTTPEPRTPRREERPLRGGLMPAAPAPAPARSVQGFSSANLISPPSTTPLPPSAPTAENPVGQGKTVERESLPPTIQETTPSAVPDSTRPAAPRRERKLRGF